MLLRRSRAPRYSTVRALAPVDPQPATQDHPPDHETDRRMNVERFHCRLPFQQRVTSAKAGDDGRLQRSTEPSIVLIQGGHVGEAAALKTGAMHSGPLATPGALQSMAPRARGRSRLPPTGVRSTVDVEYLSGYLACVREVQHGVNDIIDARNLSHRLQRPKKLFRIILVHWRVHDSWGYRVEPDPFLGVLDR